MLRQAQHEDDTCGTRRLLMRACYCAATFAGRGQRAATCRQHLLDQLAGLGQHLLAARAHRAQDEFRDAGGDVLGDPLDDHAGIADGEIAVGVAAGALGVGLHRPLQRGLRRAAEIEREARAVMVVVDAAPGLGGGSLDGGDDARGLRRRLRSALPAGTEARGAPDCGLRAAADPHRQVGLHRLGREGGARQAVVLAGEVDAVLAPQAAHDLQPFVGLAAARARCRRAAPPIPAPAGCRCRRPAAGGPATARRWWRTAWPPAPDRAAPATPRSCRT